VRKPDRKQGSGEVNKLLCESTIESANRRNFIKKAAAITAVTAVGATVLTKDVNLIPVSSARSQERCSCGCFCSVHIDIFGHNNATCHAYSLRFGGAGCNTETGIYSNRHNCEPNKFGLCFFTSNIQRLSIANCGNVGIGTRTPSSTLEVNGPVKIDSALHVVGNVGIGTCTPSSLLEVAGTATIDSTLTLKGCSPNIIASTPTSTLSILGNMSATGSLCVAGAITGTSVYGKGCGVTGTSVKGRGIYGASCCCSGILGISANSAGVVAGSISGPGLLAQASNPLTAKFQSSASSGDRSSLLQFENACSTPIKWNAGVAGCSNASSIPKGSFYIQRCGVTTPVLAINESGSIGLGTQTINTTLAVNGSIAAKTRSVSASTTLLASDFAIFASGKITLTLPAADTQNGMMLFIKNASTSAVTVAATGSDKIEGKTSKTLSKEYDSLTLISNGASPGTWYILSNAT
jgi:hypothetical protein